MTRTSHILHHWLFVWLIPKNTLECFFFYYYYYSHGSGSVGDAAQAAGEGSAGELGFLQHIQSQLNLQHSTSGLQSWIKWARKRPPKWPSTISASDCNFWWQFLPFFTQFSICLGNQSHADDWKETPILFTFVEMTFTLLLSYSLLHLICFGLAHFSWANNLYVMTPARFRIVQDFFFPFFTAFFLTCLYSAHMLGCI